MNFTRDVVDAADPARRALVALSATGERREIAFGEVADRSARLAGALAARGVRRGDVVMTLIGNRPEWVYAMVACWRLGAAALPCTEQLRPADLRARMDKVEPRSRRGARAPRRAGLGVRASTGRSCSSPTSGSSRRRTPRRPPRSGPRTRR